MESYFKKNYAVQSLFDEPMKKHTSFKIGGPAKIFFVPSDLRQIVDVIAFCKKNNVKYFVMGNGTNLLVADEGFDGVIIKVSKNLSDVSVEESEDNQGKIITSDSGTSLAYLSKVALRENLSGLEFAFGIPGTVGGAVCMNAGAFGSEIKNIFVSAQILVDGQIKTFSDLNFSYRHSLIDQNHIVVSAKFKLCISNHDDIYKKMTEYRNKRVDTQPLDFPSAGSTFKRPQNNFAGKLIMDAGLAGYKIGGACVSEKHCGFIVNIGDATAKDVLNLIEHIQSVVQKKFGVFLEPEVKFLF